jgi:hypothetical protein
VRLVLRLGLDELRVLVVEIIVAVGETEAALGDVGGVTRVGLQVLIDLGVERRRDTELAELAEGLGEIACAADRGDAVEIGPSAARCPSPRSRPRP